ncbi:cytochrome c oxidase subunit 4 [Agrococcus lahaulensis]|uniref:cytochrome c oxidase subunit 4 n=1 Tax=Agrococcus lahaulensis TaxID=341722 RepID=UPI00047A0CCF|nr:cytochrome c oxidase subunit 4 [Agrococcus lahaulensis]
MRVNIILMAILTAFFLLCSAAYTIWHMLAYDGRVEWAGTLGLALTGLMSGLIGFYLVLVRRGQGGVEHPSDRLDAEIDDADPEEGHFSPWSWWPLGVGFALALVFLSPTGPTFLIPIAAVLLIIMLVGWVYEHYRGNFTH